MSTIQTRFKTPANRRIFDEILWRSSSDEIEALNRFLTGLEKVTEESVALVPGAYGVLGDKAGQMTVAKQEFDRLSLDHLKKYCGELRRRAGYVRIFNVWVTRPAITFALLTTMACVALPFSLFLFLSTIAWGWLWGIVGFATTGILMRWTYKRINPEVIIKQQRKELIR